MHRTLSVLAFLVGGLLAIIGTGPAHAQSGMRSVGAVATGGGTSALDTGPAAIFSNPANLTVGPRKRALEVQLVRIGAYTGGDFFQFNNIDPLFYGEGPALSNEEQKNVLDDWFGDEMRSASTYTEVVPLSFTYRPSEASWAAGFGIRARTFQTAAANQGLFDALLRGTGTDRSFPIDGRSRQYSTIDLTGSFSYRLSSLPLSLGVSPRVIFGVGFANASLDSRAVVSGDSLTHRFDYTARAAGPLSSGLYDTFDLFDEEPVDEVLGGSAGIAGTGFGVDLGGTYTVRPGLYVSASITDLGLISWSQDAQTVTPTNNTFRFDGVTLDLDRLDKEFDNDLSAYVENQVDSLAREAYEDVERDRSSFTAGLPTTLHVSGTWDPVDLATLNGGISVGLNEEAGAVPDPAAVHLGGRLNLGPFPIRAGVRFWGNQAVTLSGGFGLDFGFYQLDLGASVTPNTATLGSGARYAVSFSLATIRL
jgi:hypothetical protein